MTPTDSELVALARGGSQAACLEIVCRYQRPVFNLIIRMVRDRALAEDLSQETFLKAFSRLDRFDSRFKLSNWMFKIAHNTVIDHLRLRRPPTVPIDPSMPGRRGPAEDLIDSATVNPVEALEHAELAKMLEDAVARLRPEYRQVVILRYHEDLSHEEISDIMGIPVGTVKSYLHRARAELAHSLKQALPADVTEGRPADSATGTPPDS